MLEDQITELKTELANERAARVAAEDLCMELRLWMTGQVAELEGTIKAQDTALEMAEMANPGKVKRVVWTSSPLPERLGFQPKRKRCRAMPDGPEGVQLPLGGSAGSSAGKCSEGASSARSV
jgi:hypothetical protein